MDLIKKFDGDDALKRTIQKNEEVKIPDVAIHSEEWSRVFDERKPDEQRKLPSIVDSWKAPIKGDVERYSDFKTLVKYKVFELSLDGLSDAESRAGGESNPTTPPGAEQCADIRRHFHRNGPVLHGLAGVCGPVSQGQAVSTGRGWRPL